MAGHKVEAATADSEQRATVSAVVRRFQGRYECGCTVDFSLPFTPECREHGEPGIYVEEPLMVDNVEIGPAFDEFTKEV